MSNLINQLDQGVIYLDKDKEKESEKVATEKLGAKNSVPKMLFKYKHYLQSGGEVKLNTSKTPDYQGIQKYPSYKANFNQGAKDYINRGYASEISAAKLTDDEKEELGQILDFVGALDLDFLTKGGIKSANTQISVPGNPPKGMYGNIYATKTPEEIKNAFDSWHKVVNCSYDEFSKFAVSPCAKAVNFQPKITNRTQALLFKAEANSWTVSDANWANMALIAIADLREKCNQHTCKPIKLIDGTVCGSEVETALASFGVKV